MFKEDEEEETCLWECQVRYVTFIGIGKDAHTFALITDMGQQRFQCTAFWCEPDAGIISEAVQAACMVNVIKLTQDFMRGVVFYTYPYPGLQFAAEPQRLFSLGYTRILGCISALNRSKVLDHY